MRMIRTGLLPISLWGLMIADVFPGGKRTFQICPNQIFRAVSRCPDYDLDPVLIEQALRAGSHAPGDDKVRSLFGHPLLEYARFGPPLIQMYPYADFCL